MSLRKYVGPRSFLSNLTDGDRVQSAQVIDLCCPIIASIGRSSPSHVALRRTSRARALLSAALLRVPGNRQRGGAKGGDTAYWGSGAQYHTRSRGKQTQCSDSCALLLKGWSSRRSEKVWIKCIVAFQWGDNVKLLSLRLFYLSDLAASSFNVHRSNKQSSSSSTQLELCFCANKIANLIFFVNCHDFSRFTRV